MGYSLASSCCYWHVEERSSGLATRRGPGQTFLQTDRAGHGKVVFDLVVVRDLMAIWSAVPQSSLGYYIYIYIHIHLHLHTHI